VVAEKAKEEGDKEITERVRESKEGVKKKEGL
jgi:hypothetical protein